MIRNSVIHIIIMYIASIAFSILSGFIQLKGLFSDYYELVNVGCFITGPAIYTLTNIFINKKVVPSNINGDKYYNVLVSIYLPVIMTFHYLILNMIVHLSISDMSKHWALWLIPTPILFLAIYTKLKAVHKLKNLVVYISVGAVVVYYIYLFYGLMLIGNHV